MATRYSVEEINKMKLPDCKKLLLEYVSELREYDEILGEYDNDGEDAGNRPLTMMRMFAAGMEKMKVLQTKVDNMTSSYEETKTQNQEHEKIKDTLELQQSMVESLDRKTRESHIIITGVKEDQPLEEAGTDEEKCKKILTTIGCTEEGDSVKSVLRLGKSDNKKRPLLVVGKDVAWRNKIIDNTEKLKTAGVTYKEVFIKKDVHPAVRREWWRLHSTKEREEGRPENVGHKISIDYKRRVVLRDDVVIDKWSPTNNFPSRGPRS